MMRIILISSMLLFIVSDIHWGGCPKVHYELESFDTARYTGLWYEIARSSSIPFEFGECCEESYTLKENGGLGVLNSVLLNGVRSSLSMDALPTDNQFQFKLDFGGIASKFIKGDYQIINTDYEGFVLVYSCTDLVVAKNEWFWILSRTPQMNSNTLDTLLAYLKNTFNLQTDASLTYSNHFIIL